MDPTLQQFFPAPDVFNGEIQALVRPGADPAKAAQEVADALNISDGDLKACLAWSIVSAKPETPEHIHTLMAGVRTLAQRKVESGADVDGALGKLLNVANQVWGAKNTQVQREYIIDHAKSVAEEQFKRMQSGAIKPAEYGKQIVGLFIKIVNSPLSATYETSLREVYAAVVPQLVNLSKESGGAAKVMEVLSTEIPWDQETKITPYALLMLWSSEDSKKQLTDMLNPEELRRLLLFASETGEEPCLVGIVSLHQLDKHTLAKAFGIDTDLSSVYASTEKCAHGKPEDNFIEELGKWVEGQPNPTERLKALFFLACLGHNNEDTRYSDMVEAKLSPEDRQRIFTELSPEEVIPFLKMMPYVLLKDDKDYAEALPVLEKHAMTEKGRKEVLEIAQENGNKIFGISSPEKFKAALPLLRSLLDTPEGMKLVVGIAQAQILAMSREMPIPEKAQPVIDLLLDIAKDRDGAVILYNDIKNSMESSPPETPPKPVRMAWARSLILPMYLSLSVHIDDSKLNRSVTRIIRLVNDDGEGFANFPKEFLFRAFSHRDEQGRTLLFYDFQKNEPLLEKLSSEQIKKVLAIRNNDEMPIIHLHYVLKTLLVDTTKPSLLRSSHVEPQDLRELFLLLRSWSGNVFQLALICGFLDKEIAHKALGVDFDPDEVKAYKPAEQQNLPPNEIDIREVEAKWRVAMTKWVDREQDAKTLLNTLYIATMIGYGDIAFGKLEHLSPEDRVAFLGMFKQKDIESILAMKGEGSVPLLLNTHVRRYVVPWLEKMNPDQAYDSLLKEDGEDRTLLHDPVILKEAEHLLSVLKDNIREDKFFGIWIKRDQAGNTILHSAKGFAAALSTFRQLPRVLQERLLVARNNDGVRVLKFAMECEAIDETGLKSLYDHYPTMEAQLKAEVAANRKPPEEEPASADPSPSLH